MLDKFDWDALMLEIKKHPIRSKILIATPPRHAPCFITNGCSDGIEPMIFQVLKSRSPSRNSILLGTKYEPTNY